MRLSQAKQFALSLADQVLSVGGMFLVNIALARTQSKTEYGVFALCYSVFTFLSGLHNAAILETYTVYGSGRYNGHFEDYEALLWRSNRIVGVVLTLVLLAIWGGIVSGSGKASNGSVLGMALASAVLLTASFVRRTFYMRRRPDLAARFSATYFVVCAVMLVVSLKVNLLTGLTAFLIAAVAWLVAGASVAHQLPGNGSRRTFTEIEPGYWGEHWKYARWVFVTALVFQFTTQAYYWLAAGILNVGEVANLRAMYNIVTPIEQVLSAAALLVLPVMAHRYASRRTEGLLPVWKGYVFGSVIATGGFSLLILVLGRRGMHLLYGGKFDDISVLVILLSLLPLFMSVGNTMNAALKAMEKPQAVFYAYAISGASTFAVGIPLILHWGLRGAVLGMLVSGTAYTVTLGVAFSWFIYFCAKKSEVQIALEGSERLGRVG
jgi:O-antigen/teichoic acid export membrane protein